MAKAHVAPDAIELTYSLAELPTSQHRAGLVGLVLVIEELQRIGQSGLEVEVSEDGARVRFDEAGLGAILNEIYAASEEFQGRDAPLKGVEPSEIRVEVVLDKKGKEKLKKVYVYPVIVPRGSFLGSYDSSENGAWIKLWRAMIWQILRGVPATRKPFDDRAHGLAPADIATVWKQLNQDRERSIDLPSTYFLGAQAFNAERVPFKDNGRAQFLLHFWPFVCQVYVPQRVDREGKRSFDGFAIAVPDVSRLRSFCADYKMVLDDRAPATSGYRPREAIIEIPEEAGLDTVRRLNRAVSEAEGKSVTADIVFGVDVFHMLKDGNNVRVLYCGRVEPEHDRDQEYVSLKSMLFDSSFKRRRLLNLVYGRDWYSGFDFLLSMLPLETGLCSPYFAHDARVSIQTESANRRVKMRVASGEQSTKDDVCLEELVLKIVDSYVRQKLRDKYGLEWSKLDGDGKKRAEYNERREGIGKECFYAIRSRTGEDFIGYFASTICSVPHWMTQEEYACITRTLYEETEKVRTLSMLALSARIGRERKEEQVDG